jgi:hypothetical protein
MRFVIGDKPIIAHFTVFKGISFFAGTALLGKFVRAFIFA